MKDSRNERRTKIKDTNGVNTGISMGIEGSSINGPFSGWS